MLKQSFDECLDPEFDNYEGIEQILVVHLEKYCYTDNHTY